MGHFMFFQTIVYVGLKLFRMYALIKCGYLYTIAIIQTEILNATVYVLAPT